ncbi:3-dehydroquinate synthase [Shewanella marina]|uniref:3-dehydroquinate synthase n=1 Tax=Shewanella marina TaxID=487319 RepID=UPI000471DD19|nr:3-dehydroquinate synthase [Shewanella marina]
MKQVQVELENRRYSIEINPKLFEESEALSRFLLNKRVLIVTNDTVAPLYLNSLQQLITGASEVRSVILPDGEQYKTLAYLDNIYTALLEHNFSRDSVLIALGGGVIGDMTGFAAASYQRGIDFIQVPTTLLSQVDSSVGGKTAVNHVLGKNMIGAFYQPKYVMIDTDCLTTLPAREFAAGMAEVIKYGIMWDSEFFSWLESNVQKIKQLDAATLSDMIGRCCEIKAQVVAEDETEQGVRALLNLGHTYGHAIEAEMGYGVWLHGEAVASGMMLAAQTSVQLGLMTESQLAQIKALLLQFDLPTHIPDGMHFEHFIKHMRRDKKVLAGKIRLVLPEGIGRAGIYANITDEQLKQVIN